MTPKCRCASFVSTSVREIDSAYYALYKVTDSALRHSVTLSCRFFTPRCSRHLYIDLIGKMIVCDTWYTFLESTEGMEMVKFTYLFIFFALCVMSNKKLKIQGQKHQYFYSMSPPVAEKILSPQSIFVATLILCNQKAVPFL